MAVYTDLLITGNDLTLDAAGEPLLITDRDCITQDIEHLIRDSGLLLQLIGQRDELQRADLLQRLVLMIEDDERLIPGTVSIEETELGRFFIAATTYQFGAITLEASNNV